MEQYGKPAHINDHSFRFILDLLGAETAAPSMSINLAMDTLFKDQKWWEFEYETLLQMFEQFTIPYPNVHILGQIQALSALRNGESLIDKEWHIFEKCVLAITGIPVLFYEKQNVPIEHIAHAISLFKKLGTADFSDEVRHYIGCEAINDDILWHPMKHIDDCISYALNNLGSSLGIPKDEVDVIRKKTESRFQSILNKDLDTISFDDSSIEDMMCLRLYRSLLIGRELYSIEASSMSMLESLLDGRALYNGNMFSEKPSDSVEESSLVMEERDPNEVFEYNIEELTSSLTPDTVSFEDGVKEATIKALDEIVHVYHKDDLTIKLSQIEGVPIPTGIPSGGEEDDSTGPSFDLEETAPLEGNAIEAMQQALDNDVSKVIEPSSRHEIEDNDSIFEL